MKKLLCIVSIVFIVSCGKDNTPNTLNCKLTKIIHLNGSSDTTLISYSGDNITVRYGYSSYPDIYLYTYTKSGSQYLLERFTNGVLSLNGFLNLTAQGLVDTSAWINQPAATFNSRSKNTYNADGYITRAITNYNTYENDIKYHYSGGNYSYWIYDQYNFSVPANSTKDSVVFEYYNDLKRAEKYVLESKYGKLEKNLVKKWYFYNMLNSNILRKTYEYEYLTDENGLITRQIFTSKNQPGDVVTSRDTTYYQYICD